MQEACSTQSAGSDGLQRSHAVFNHQLEFSAVFAVCSDTRIRTHGNRHTSFYSATKALSMRIHDLVRLLHHLWRNTVWMLLGKFSDPDRRNQRWYKVSALLSHQIDRLLIQINTMFNRSDTSTECILDALITLSMGH